MVRVGKSMHIGLVTAEISPLKTTGGLGHAVHGLARALVRAGHRVSIFTPAHTGTLGLAIRHGTATRRKIHIQSLPDIELEFGGKKESAWVFTSNVPFSHAPNDRMKFYFIDNASQTRFGNRVPPYGYPDDAERYLFFNQAVARLVQLSHDKQAKGIEPLHILQCNDWSSAFVGYYLRNEHSQYERPPFTPLLYVVHNLGYSNGIAMDSFYRYTGDKNPWVYDPIDGMGFHGYIDPHKTALLFSDRTVTVSPNYAQEILSGNTPPPGNLYAGVLQKYMDRVGGILNGIPEDYGPDDLHAKGVLPETYGPENLEGKKACRKYLQELAGLNPDPESMLLISTGRWAEQKGIDVVQQVLPKLLSRLNIQFITIGSEPRNGRRYEKGFLKLQEQFPGQVGVFDFHAMFTPTLTTENLESMVYAGGDAMLMPSRYEPCGLGDLYSLKHGTPVIAHHTGGLADAIQDKETGFLFHGVTATNITAAIERAYEVFKNHPETWQKMVIAAMQQDFSWPAAAVNYIDLYHEVVEFWAQQG